MKILWMSAAGLLLAAAALFTVKSPPLFQPQDPSAKAAPSQGSQSGTPPGASKSAATSGRKIPCKTPENASLCYWTHGRLSYYAQHPPLRVWKIGTDRLLGVFSGPSRFPPRDTSQLSLPELPANLSRIYQDRRNWEPPDDLEPNVFWPADVFADFQVCPLAADKPGRMQPVCIESARNVLLKK